MRRYDVVLLRCITLLLSITTISGCGNPMPPCVDICAVSGVVRGVVKDEGGSPVAGAMVGILVFRDTCEPKELRSFLGEAKTDSLGRFRALATSTFAPFTAGCVSVTVEARDGLPETMHQFPTQLEMRFEDQRHDTPRDSVLVTVVLPAVTGG
jgi:hypothetical protein